MKKILTATLALVLSMGILSGCSKPNQTPDSSSQPEQEEISPTETAVGDPNKKAILVVSFGTSYNDTRAVTIDAIESEIATAFPDYDVKRAFTSQMIINKLAERDGLEIDNVDQTMKRLIAEGYGTVICQPTHVMNGFEYDDMVAEVSAYKDNFAVLKCGTPLLTASEDYEILTQTLKKIMPETQEQEAVVFMGHGTDHPSNAAYPALAYQFLLDGNSNFFVGTVEGFPEIDTIVRLAKEKNIKKIYLTPLMVVAGDHANNDMAGDEDDSWKTILKSEGFEVELILKGLGEYPEIRALYVAHTQAAIDSITENAEGEE
jgi:sirohydrochlorin cobaltochelatase